MVAVHMCPCARCRGNLYHQAAESPVVLCQRQAAQQHTGLCCALNRLAEGWKARAMAALSASAPAASVGCSEQHPSRLKLWQASCALMHVKREQRQRLATALIPYVVQKGQHSTSAFKAMTMLQSRRRKI